jgi:SAM-dependent methyltransferase
MGMTKVNWDKLASLSELRAVIDPADDKGFKNRLIDEIHWKMLKSALKKSNHLLDFGCGTGRFAQRLARMGIDYTGIDTSADMIKTAIERNAQTGLKFVHYDGLALPFPDKNFDTCISCWVYQYVVYSENNQRTLAEIQRCLVPEGRFVLIEQASLSNQSSGSVARPSTETDYVTELAKYFHVNSVNRIRMCQLSRLSGKSFEVFSRIPTLFGFALGYLADWEIHRAHKARIDSYSKLQYYDILIEAERPTEG